MVLLAPLESLQSWNFAGLWACPFVLMSYGPWVEFLERCEVKVSEARSTNSRGNRLTGKLSSTLFCAMRLSELCGLAKVSIRASQSKCAQTRANSSTCEHLPAHLTNSKQTRSPPINLQATASAADPSRTRRLKQSMFGGVGGEAGWALRKLNVACNPRILLSWQGWPRS